MAEAAHYTPRIGARSELAAMIKSNQLELAKFIGLTEYDLDQIITHGEAAREADRQQQVQLADLQAERTSRSLMAADIFEREEGMRDRLAAVIDALKTTHPTLADFLAALSFSRYRFRVLPVSAETLADDPEIKKVERVEREDHITRLTALSQFCTSLLEPGREPIIEALAARALPREAIETLGADAEALAKKGRNLPSAAEATAREAAAVTAQRRHWSLTSKMFRKVVARANDPVLKAKLSEC